MLFERLILYLLSFIENQRTTSSIYHILKGKKSAQTIQDSQLFRLSPYLGILPKLSKDEFDCYIDRLISKGLLLNSEELTYLTEEAHKLNKEDQWFSNLYFNGEKYSQIALPFYRKLQLLVQTTSHLIKGHNNFLPVSDNDEVQRDVKNVLKESELISSNGEGLYQELHQLFQLVDEKRANLMMLSFTGADQVGLSITQIASEFNQPERVVQLHIISTVHLWIEYILKDHNHFPVCYKFLMNRNETSLTHSAQVTYEKVGLGYTVEQIAYIRHLKRSTIEDHIVEIATKDQAFKIDEYVSQHVYSLIEKAINHLTTKRLKLIKEQLPEHVTYFQIRLTMARLGAEHHKQEVQDGQSI
ncbi:helix-turn-helix domain-containing protein [Alkalibacillus haloalkaliphilus]|uniref:helix-turn-helix domain-containing protein n=1 Tax=Alkalibacillus haloalkaliphilus TaxID=94136 RepID=UPI0002F04722|nr:helix-turn-helix domain-containing protein [Alkalibacillus haloalkaliphilus]